MTEGRAGDEAPWIGVNYWSRSGGPRMWARYDRSVVRAELAALAEHGCNVTRSFCYWPDFVPEPETLDPDVAERFSDFLDAHREYRLGTIPTFIVGFMSGESWDPVWRHGRDLYRDVWMVSQQAWFAAEIARRFGNHPAIVGWLISNEMPLYAGAGSVDEITAWARILIQAVRSAGAAQPISLGDGAWGVEVRGHDNGYSLRSLAPLVDFFGPHVYPKQDDRVREFLFPAFVCELAGGFGRPVVLEEFGASSDFASGEHAAAYYRQVLYSTLLAGAKGWLPWNNCDYDNLWDEDPYRSHAFEMHFGLIDSVGRPKPQFGEFTKFSAFVRENLKGGWRRAVGTTALVVPEHFERVLHGISDSDRKDIHDNLFQAYIAAREADLPVELIRERDGIREGQQLYLVPSAVVLTAPGIRRLRELANGGATIYLSYFAGSTGGEGGPWLTWLDEIFGVEHELQYGLVNAIDEPEVTIEFVQDVGDISAGTSLSFPVGGTPHARAYLPVKPAGATVIAVDGHGRPALLRYPLGAGVTFLCTYPIEHMAARTANVNPENTWRLYAALAGEAGVARRVRIADPRILTGVIRSGESHLAIFANTSCDPVHADLLTAEGFTSSSPTQRDFGPFEVVIVPVQPVPAGASTARTKLKRTE